jgi:hypothetical protein
MRATGTKVLASRSQRLLAAPMHGVVMVATVMDFVCP